MGCFDSVYIKCPRCGFSVKFQSKAGECKLATYSEKRVPAEIAKSIKGTVETCPNCRHYVEATTVEPIPMVAMKGKLSTGWKS